MNGINFLVAFLFHNRICTAQQYDSLGNVRGTCNRTVSPSANVTL